MFGIDRWITGPVLGDDQRFHPLGHPYDSTPAEEAAPLDLDATPTLDEVLAVRTERTALVDRLVREATDRSLAQVVESPDGGTTTVGDCIRVVLQEEWWHHRYANRDLACSRPASTSDLTGTPTAPALLSRQERCHADDRFDMRSAATSWWIGWANGYERAPQQPHPDA